MNHTTRTKEKGRRDKSHVDYLVPENLQRIY